METSLHATPEVSENYYGINLIIGSSGSGKTTTLNSILQKHMIHDKVIIEADSGWNLPKSMDDGLFNARSHKVPVFILSQNDNVIPFTIRKNAVKIIFTDPLAMEVYFCRAVNGKQYITKMEEYQYIKKIFSNNITKVMYHLQDNKFEIITPIIEKD